MTWIVGMAKVKIEALTPLVAAQQYAEAVAMADKGTPVTVTSAETGQVFHVLVDEVRFWTARYAP